MSFSSISSRFLLTVALAFASPFVPSLVPSGALAQDGQEAQEGEPAKPFEPYSGQPGRDVVWVPTPEVTVETMLDFAKVTPDDYVIDLGSGDGRMVIAAAKRGVRGHGVEFNPKMVELSNKLAREAGVADKAKFIQGDMYEADISRATVLPLFLLTENLNKLVPNFLKLRPGTRIVVNAYRIDGWDHDGSTKVEKGCTSWCQVYLYIVPAPVAGTWRLGDAELTISQDFQKFTGSLGDAQIEDGILRGDRISFSVGDTRYTGRVNGGEMRGEATGGRAGSWVATRS